MTQRLRLTGPTFPPRVAGIVVTTVDVHGDRAITSTAPESLDGGRPTSLRKIGGKWYITVPADLRLVFTPPN